jgi:hypothetical protein
MNTPYNDPEFINSFLRGELPQEQMAQFEAALQKDPVLKQEIQMQQDIVNSLKAYRKNQLKARLDALDAAGGGSITQFTALKIAASIGLTAIVTYGAYLFFDEKQAVVTDPVLISNERKAITETLPVPELKKPEIKEETVWAPVKKKKKAFRDEQPEKSVNPNFVDGFKDSDPTGKKDLETPTGELANTQPGAFEKTEVVTEKSKSAELKYKFVNKKLYLYGDFHSKPYELMEFNTVSGRIIYLFHEGEYYVINPDQVQVTILQKLSDKVLIKQLDLQRGNNTEQ